MTPILVVLCTCPDEATAKRIAGALVARRRAACVNLVGPVRSVFVWEGEVCDESEMLLIAKTTEEGYPALEEIVHELHPYDVPEVIAVPVAAGSRPYLDWVAGSVGGSVTETE
jgi:periplasmic divalent cation tolerance protein